jgi:branched-chain amino acid transport system substrate-binding protein
VLFDCASHAAFARMTNNIEELLMTLSRLTSISVAAVLFAAGAAAQAETVKIAFAGPMSGSVAQYGDMVKAGVLTAVEQINAAGGAGGNKLELVTMDDAHANRSRPSPSPTRSSARRSST